MYISRSIQFLKLFFDYFLNFGFFYAIKKIYFLKKGDVKGEINLLLDFLTTIFHEELENIDRPTELLPPIKKHYVWSMWWQGEESLPEVLKICYESHKRHIASHNNIEYVLITQYNYKNYVEVPQYIKDKLGKKIISFTHFSDLLRVLLLEKYGGAWIDITLFVARPIDITMFNSSFYSINLTDSNHSYWGVGQHLTKCQWAGFFLVSPMPHSCLFRYIKECMLKYWKRYTYPIDYFFLNGIIRCAYLSNIKIKYYIDNVPQNNVFMYDLQQHMNKPFDNILFESMLADTTYFKLTQKTTYKLKCDGCDTTYSILHKQYVK